MSEVPEQPRDQAILDLLAEASLEIALDLKRRALEAETVQDASTAAMAFQRVARTARQCLALKDRMLKGQPLEPAARPKPAEPPPNLTPRERREDLPNHVAYEMLLDANEYDALDDDDYGDLELKVHGAVKALLDKPQSLKADPEAQIAQLCETLGIPERAPRWREFLPEGYAEANANAPKPTDTS